ncbi:putative ATP synthase YscN [Labrenzia sp. THAF82]|uniref:type III secretion system ATPase SctN n=1 Tax=Labrenzia sp. THAF82 TaxID=2587861 RepID=UPI001267CDF7|nr:type III secretion system ATPase SctN [Labrenzia sp. THAF82]QFT33941.1 putative ATP synthase YscN [Labrenzia sp. THAF82]
MTFGAQSEYRRALEERRSKIDARFDDIVSKLSASVDRKNLYSVNGKVSKVIGTVVYAVVSNVRIGEIVELYTRSTGNRLEAEVVGFANNEALLYPFGETQGVSPQTEVRATGKVQSVPVGHQLLGRVIDGFGNFIDGKSDECTPKTWYPVYQNPPDPMTRRVIDAPITTGVRAIDGLLTIGEGQRIGIFAAAGVGKSTLLSMLVKRADVDVTVMALVGERGREVREFIERELGPAGLKKTVLVVSTSDKSPMERVKASYTATAIAEYFRDQGKKVLFLMDSVTRFARALREIGLAAGELPTRRGFPPSVFASLPKLLERVGMNDKGSITAMYTVLVEGDDMNEPVADETRSILDGHIVLSSKLAAAHHFPAIDVLNSKSRVMNAVISEEHDDLAAQTRNLLAAYADVELLVKIGEYQAGSDPVADRAVERIREINDFLKQGDEPIEDLDETLERLRSALN